MKQKTQTILTTIVGAVLTAVSTISIALAPKSISTIIVTISGMINECINIVTEKFVKE